MHDINRLKSMAKYVIYPCNGRYKSLEKWPKDIIKMPLVKDSNYTAYPLNGHHFMPFYHIEYVLPKLEDIFHFGYKREDFNLHERMDGKHDVSYLEPKKDVRFDFYNLTSGEHLEDATYSDIVDCKPKTNEFTPYHTIFRCAHQCGRLINKGENNGRTIVISCDSQMIPVIPVMCCYFNEVWCLDNRDNKPHITNLDTNTVTDVLIAGGFNGENKYLVDNFK